MAVLSNGLASRFTSFVGLKGAQLSGQVTLGAIEAAGGAIQHAGKQFAAGALRGAIDGLVSGMVGEVVLTAADEATWRRSVWDVVASFGGAILRGGTIGAVTGGVVGGGLEALAAFVQRSRIESLVSDLEAAGIARSQLDNLSMDTVTRIGQLDAAFAASDMAEAQRLMSQLSGEIDAGRMRLFEAALVRRYLGESALAAQGLTNMAGAADVLPPGFRASADDLAHFRTLCSDPTVASWFTRDLGGTSVDEWYDAIIARLGADHPAVAGLSNAPLERRQHRAGDHGGDAMKEETWQQALEGWLAAGRPGGASVEAYRQWTHTHFDLPRHRQLHLAEKRALDEAGWTEAPQAFEAAIPSFRLEPEGRYATADGSVKAVLQRIHGPGGAILHPRVALTEPAQPMLNGLLLASNALRLKGLCEHVLGGRVYHHVPLPGEAALAPRSWLLDPRPDDARDTFKVWEQGGEHIEIGPRRVLLLALELQVQANLRPWEGKTPRKRWFGGVDAGELPPWVGHVRPLHVSLLAELRGERLTLLGRDGAG